MRYVVIFLLSLAFALIASVINAQVVNTPHDIAWPLTPRYICVNFIHLMGPIQAFPPLEPEPHSTDCHCIL
jgi:hypothetical protein